MALNDVKYCSIINVVRLVRDPVYYNLFFYNFFAKYFIFFIIFVFVLLHILPFRPLVISNPFFVSVFIQGYFHYSDQIIYINKCEAVWPICIWIILSSRNVMIEHK